MIINTYKNKTKKFVKIRAWISFGCMFCLFLYFVFTSRYETLNFISKKQIPLIVVCENFKGDVGLKKIFEKETNLILIF